MSMNVSVTGFFDLPLDVRRQVYRRARFLEAKERVEGRFQISSAGIYKWVGDKVVYAVYHGTPSEWVRPQPPHLPVGFVGLRTPPPFPGA